MTEKLQMQQRMSVPLISLYSIWRATWHRRWWYS